MPAFCKFYGITPADIDQMTVREISEFLVQMDKALQAQAE